MLIMVGAIIALGGCMAGEKPLIRINPEGLQLSEATLPNYAVGEYFAFDDGITEIVTEKSGELITWQTNTDTVSRGYHNFIIPALTWTNVSRYSEGTTNAPVDLLWPLAVGKTAQYEFQQIISRHDGTEATELFRSWDCAVESTRRVSVAAGNFDTYVITCKRYSSTSNSWRATRRFYYAPDLGHYVIREDTYQSRPDRRRELVSYGFNSNFLPKRDQIKLNRTLQSTLSKNGDGMASTWISRTGKVTAMLIPVRSFTGTNGDTCREYHSVYSVQGRIRKNVREVCRQPDGLWQRIN
jgi:hypothetical protein